MLLKNILSSFSRLKVTPQAAVSRLNVSFQLGQAINARATSLAMFKPAVASFSLFTPRLDLMEFFDERKNWPELLKVKHGRSWRMDELRLKSNIDLHKLWYILHKERNMLLTMEEFYIQKDRRMPSHERIAKVNV